jgi:hypothetical protein
MGNGGGNFFHSKFATPPIGRFVSALSKVRIRLEFSMMEVSYEEGAHLADNALISPAMSGANAVILT